MIAERTDPALFALSYDYVGDLSETVALLWPEGRRTEAAPTLAEIVLTLEAAHKAALPGLVAGWLDRLDETGRWALLKLITGALRIGVSARLAKAALAEIGGVDVDEIEKVWFGLTPPYAPLFDWLEGRGQKPAAGDGAPFRPVMLAHPLEDRDFATMQPADFAAEWKWDGIRVQLASGKAHDGSRITRLYSRAAEDISAAFPDLVGLDWPSLALDGELLILREGLVQSFNVLQQRLNRKSVTPAMLREYPAHLRLYDVLAIDGEDCRERPFGERRKALEELLPRLPSERCDLSPLIPFSRWDELAAFRTDPSLAHAGEDHAAIEGLVIKCRDGAYLPGRPKGQWFKWKREPRLIDAVLMYAQRGHGKRSSFYSDFTFGVWKGETLTPVGKAYFGFTDEELKELDRYIRSNTGQRFGPVREVLHGRDRGLVFEVAFEGLQRSSRHKSGVAMRFPRLNRIRWDKPAAEADSIETLLAMIEAAERPVPERQ